MGGPILAAHNSELRKIILPTSLSILSIVLLFNIAKFFLKIVETRKNFGNYLGLIFATIEMIEMIYFFKRQPHKMVKHTQTIRRLFGYDKDYEKVNKCSDIGKLHEIKVKCDFSVELLRYQTSR